MRQKFFSKNLLLFLLLAFSNMLCAQKTTEEYGITHNMPVFYEQLKAMLTFPLSYEHCTHDSSWTYNHWRDEARKAIFQTMQMAPPAPSDFSYEILAEEKHEGYTTQLIAFNINQWERVKAYLLVPTDKTSKTRETSKYRKVRKASKPSSQYPTPNTQHPAPACWLSQSEATERTPNTQHPAILLLHDHGAHFSIGKEKMVRPLLSPSKETLSNDSTVLKDAEDWSTKCYDGIFVGDELAKQGFVVLAIDALFWGDRGATGIKELGNKGAREFGFTGTKEQKQKIYNVQEALSSNLLQMGTSWGAWITWDDIRSAAFLAHLPMVDSNRVGCLGHSMGGYRSWMLAALSDDIKASAAVCWLNDTEHLMTLTNNQNKGGSAYAMLIPGLRNLLDYPDVAALACPKPALFFNGTRDKLFPVEGVSNAYETLKSVYHDQNADSNLVTKLWDEKHYFNKQMQQEVLSFFKDKLK